MNHDDDVILCGEVEPENKDKLIAKQLMNWRRCQKPKDLKTLEKRIDAYFERCTELDMLPSIETLSLALGIHRTTVWRWASGQYCDPEWAQLISRAIATIEGFLDVAGTKGSINPVTLIWREKSRFGKSDVPGQSERERALNTSSQAERYVLPSVLLNKYLAMPRSSQKLSDDLTAPNRAKDRGAVHKYEYNNSGDWEPIPDDFDEDNVPFWMPDTTNN